MFPPKINSDPKSHLGSRRIIRTTGRRFSTRGWSSATNPLFPIVFASSSIIINNIDGEECSILSRRQHAFCLIFLRSDTRLNPWVVTAKTDSLKIHFLFFYQGTTVIQCKFTAQQWHNSLFVPKNSPSSPPPHLYCAFVTVLGVGPSSSAWAGFNTFVPYDGIIIIRAVVESSSSSSSREKISSSHSTNQTGIINTRWASCERRGRMAR